MNDLNKWRTRAISAAVVLGTISGVMITDAADAASSNTRTATVGVVHQGVASAASGHSAAKAAPAPHALIAPEANVDAAAGSISRKPVPADIGTCVKAFRGGSIPSAVIASARCGWGVSKWYANTSYYKNNWARIINQCWPNCSNGQIIRAWLGLP